MIWAALAGFCTYAGIITGATIREEIHRHRQARQLKRSVATHPAGGS